MPLNNSTVRSSSPVSEEIRHENVEKVYAFFLHKIIKYTTKIIFLIEFLKQSVNIIKAPKNE